MARIKLNKKDRISIAGKGNNCAQYVWGKAKEKWILWRAQHGLDKRQKGV